MENDDLTCSVCSYPISSDYDYKLVRYEEDVDGVTTTVCHRCLRRRVEIQSWRPGKTEKE